MRHHRDIATSWFWDGVATAAVAVTQQEIKKKYLLTAPQNIQQFISKVWCSETLNMLNDAQQPIHQAVAAAALSCLCILFIYYFPSNLSAGWAQRRHRARREGLYMACRGNNRQTDINASKCRDSFVVLMALGILWRPTATAGTVTPSSLLAGSSVADALAFRPCVLLWLMTAFWQPCQQGRVMQWDATE